MKAEKQNTKNQNNEVSEPWKKVYTMVIVVNLIYAIIFYFLMKIYS